MIECLIFWQPAENSGLEIPRNGSQRPVAQSFRVTTVAVCRKTFQYSLGEKCRRIANKPFRIIANATVTYGFAAYDVRFAVSSVLGVSEVEEARHWKKFILAVVGNARVGLVDAVIGAQARGFYQQAVRRDSLPDSDPASTIF